MVAVVIALLNMLAFVITKRHYFLYLAIAFTISIGAYLGFHRTQIRKKFNIRVCVSFYNTVAIVILNSLLSFFICGTTVFGECPKFFSALVQNIVKLLFIKKQGEMELIILMLCKLILVV